MEVASSLSLTPGMRRGPGIALYEVKLKDPHSILAHPSRGGAAKPGASKGKLPDEVVRLPKVSRATVAGAIQAIDRPVCQRPLPGIYAERPNPDFSEMPFAFPTDRDVAGGGQMFNFNSDRSTNAFADLEAQLRALGASGDRLAEATSSLRASARIFAAVSKRLSASSGRYRSKRAALKLV